MGLPSKLEQVQGFQTFGIKKSVIFRLLFSLLKDSLNLFFAKYLFTPQSQLLARLTDLFCWEAF